MAGFIRIQSNADINRQTIREMRLDEFKLSPKFLLAVMSAEQCQHPVRDFRFNRRGRDGHRVSFRTRGCAHFSTRPPPNLGTLSISASRSPSEGTYCSYRFVRMLPLFGSIT